ncbi:hypothetical protein EBU71_21960, partial [bacterium]|nr:hypothetical protein [Candidatus Elulimicrobium humile]
ATSIQHELCVVVDLLCSNLLANSPPSDETASTSTTTMDALGIEACNYLANKLWIEIIFLCIKVG